MWFGVLLHYKPTYAEVRQKTRPLALASLILLIVFVGVKLLFTLGRETAVGAFFEKAGLITAVAENSPDVLTGKIGNAFLDYKTLPTEFQFFGAVLIFWGFPLLLKIFDFRQPQDKTKIAERVHLCSDPRLQQDWCYLQSSDHFFYMSTKHFGDGCAMFSPYESPYMAFTNYMNVLGDFIVRVEEQFPLTIENEELNALLTTIKNQSSEIEMLNKELRTLKTSIENNEEAAAAAEAKPKKAPARKKATTKKATSKE